MATVTKDFRVKAGLVVEGSTATVNSHDILTEALVDQKGDLLVASGADAVTRLAVGTDNYVLTADANATNGIAWKAPAAVGVFESSITFEGATANDFETTLTVTDPTGDRTITLPDATGTVALTGDITSAIDALDTDDIEEGSTNQYFTNQRALDATSSAYDPAGSAATAQSNAEDYADGLASNYEVSGAVSTHSSLTTGVHGVTGDVVGTSDAQTLTNKSLTSPEVTGLDVVDSTIDIKTSATADYKTSVTITSPTANRTITLPDATGTVALTADVLALAGGTMTGAIAMGTNKITGLGTPTDSTDAATKSYVDSTAQGIDWKQSVRAASTENVDIAGWSGMNAMFGFDGVSGINGARVLLKNQTNAAENGIYLVSSDGSSIARAADADSGAELSASIAVFVEEGTVNADSGWTLTNNGNITVGTTNLTFTQFTGLGQVVAGDGLSKTGNTLNVTAGTGISITGDAVTNDGVLSITGTANQISATASTGAITLSTPQDIHSTATPTFSGVTVGSVTLADALMGSALATASDSATTIDTWSATTYSSAKYIVQMKKGADIEVIEVLVTVDGSNNVYLTEYADVISNTELGTTNAVYSGGNVLLQVTGASADTAVKVHKIYIEA
jgi:hypothetical protein